MRMVPRVALRAALLLLHVSNLFSKPQAGDAVTYTEAERAERAQTSRNVATAVKSANKDVVNMEHVMALAELARFRGIKHCDSPGSFSADPACPLCWGPLKLARSPRSRSAAPGSGSSKVRLAGRCLPQDTARAVGVMMAHWERTVS